MVQGSKQAVTRGVLSGGKLPLFIGCQSSKWSDTLPWYTTEKLLLQTCLNPDCVFFPHNEIQLLFTAWWHVSWCRKQSQQLPKRKRPLCPVSTCCVWLTDQAAPRWVTNKKNKIEFGGKKAKGCWENIFALLSSPGIDVSVNASRARRWWNVFQSTVFIDFFSFSLSGGLKFTG